MKGVGFKQIQRKKRLDRALQVALLGTLASCACFAVKELVRIVSGVTGKSQIVVSSGFAAAAIVAAAIKSIPKKKEIAA